MERSGLKRKCFVSVAVVMSLMVIAVPILAQQGDSAAGRMAGEQSARVATNGNLWLAAGCLGGVIGVVIAYVVEPNPPATALLGKSPEYVAAYTDGYRMAARRIQTGKAWTGCIVMAVISVGAAVLAEVAEGVD